MYPVFVHCCLVFAIAAIRYISFRVCHFTPLFEINNIAVCIISVRNLLLKADRRFLLSKICWNFPFHIHMICRSPFYSLESCQLLFIILMTYHWSKKNYMTHPTKLLERHLVYNRAQDSVLEIKKKILTRKCSRVRSRMSYCSWQFDIVFF